MPQGATVMGKMAIAARWKVCRKHAGCLCGYDPLEYKSCPFCTLQYMLNPELREGSKHKRKLVNGRAVEIAEGDSGIVEDEVEQEYAIEKENAEIESG